MQIDLLHSICGVTTPKKQAFVKSALAFRLSWVGAYFEEKKPYIKKIQGLEPIHQKYKANESTSRENSKQKKEVNN